MNVDPCKLELMDISEISSSLMREWEEWLRNTYGNNARAVSAYTPASVLM